MAAPGLTPSQVAALQRAARRDMATVTSIVGQMPGQRPAAWWLEVARIVCQRHGITSLAGHAEVLDHAIPPPALGVQPRRIVALLADGLTQSEVAESLALSPLTVKSHLARAYDQLDARNAPHAVAIALRAHLID